MDEPTARTLTRVYTVLAWIGALFLIIAGISVLFFIPKVMETAMQDPEFAASVKDIPADQLASMVKAMSIVGSIICFVGAALLTVTGVGLWRYKAWARILAIIIACLGLLLGISDLFSGNFVSALFAFIVFGVALWLFSSAASSLFVASAPVKKPAAKKKRSKR